MATKGESEENLNDIELLSEAYFHNEEHLETTEKQANDSVEGKKRTQKVTTEWDVFLGEIVDCYVVKKKKPVRGTRYVPSLHGGKKTKRKRRKKKKTRRKSKRKKKTRKRIKRKKRTRK